MAQVRVVLRDAKDDEIDRLRAEKIQLAQQQAQQHVNSENSSGSVSALVPSPPPPSVPSKSLQRLAAERLFITDCHVNTFAHTNLLAGDLIPSYSFYRPPPHRYSIIAHKILYNSPLNHPPSHRARICQDDVDAAEMMIPCLKVIEVQRIADCLKQGPKGLFHKAFLSGAGGSGGK